MSLKDLNSILEELCNTTEIRALDIPDIDLYMDQVTTFIENKLGSEKRTKKDKLLTKTMINNYSKAKILTPSKNKRYNKQQMIQLILIYYLKQVLTIGDIENLFIPLFEASESNADIIQDIYNTYLEGRKNNMKNINFMLEQNSDIISKSVQALPDSDKDKIQLIVTAMLFASQAQSYKRAAEAIIDEHFKPAT